MPNSLFKLCSDLWNKITPLKDKPTFIETEIVYLLSVIPAISLILLALLKAPLTSVLSLSGLVLAAALPAVAICYLTCRLFLKSAAETAELSAQMAEAALETQLNEAAEHGVLEAPENKFIYFFFSALIFAVSISLMVTVAVLMRGGGFQPKIFTSVMGLSAVTIMLLTVFGQSTLNFGASIQKLMGISPFKSRRSIATAWTLGIMISATAFILIFSGHRLPMTLGGWLEAWSLVAAYGIITLGCLLSGVVLSLFYKKKSPSAVFV